MDNNQNENINENEETEEGSGKSRKSLVIGLSLIFISLVLFAIITINSSNNNQPKIGSSRSDNSSQVQINRQEQLAAEQNETEGATAAEYISIIVSGTTITIDDKEYTAKEAAEKIADMGSDYGAVLTDNDASLITMTDLFQALNDKGVIYRLA